jgi:hypothetical protein
MAALSHNSFFAAPTVRSGESVPHVALIFAAAPHTMSGNHRGSPAEAPARPIRASAVRSENKPPIGE